jgi:hypothetical protein
MIEIIIGAMAVAGLFLLVDHTRKRKLRVTWWQWVLTLLGFAYAVFVLEVIVAFLDEGAAKAAMVTGVVMGFIAVIWGVVLARFVFHQKRGVAPPTHSRSA